MQSKKWEEFYNQNFTPWDSGKPEPHLVSAFAFRARACGLSVTFPEYSSDEDTTESFDLPPDGSENDIFNYHVPVRMLVLNQYYSLWLDEILAISLLGGKRTPD